jgi:hypothetical protein
MCNIKLFSVLIRVFKSKIGYNDDDEVVLEPLKNVRQVLLTYIMYLYHNYSQAGFILNIFNPESQMFMKVMSTCQFSWIYQKLQNAISS